MAQALEAPMPQVILAADFYVQLEAIDPTTGAAVAGVKVSESVLFADDAGTGATALSGPFMLVPGVADAGV